MTHTSCVPGGHQSRCSPDCAGNLQSDLKRLRPIVPAPVLCSFLAIFFILIAQNAWAHFKLNLNIRIIHVEHVEDGLDVFLRLPMPYLVANLVGPELPDGTREPAPFTTNQTVDGELMHYLDVVALQQTPLRLGQMVADGHSLHHNGNALKASVISMHVYEGQTQPPFSTLEEAKLAFAQPYKLPPGDAAPFVGDTVVDVILKYRTDTTIKDYAISSTLNPQLPGQEDTANLILDYAGKDQRIYRVTGLMDQAQVVSRSAWAAARTFVEEGIRHILSGYDHLLFVACLVIASATLSSLAWRITGFTLGHSITLTLGFFGFTPKGEWFIPLIESAIAISIIYAALLALSNKTETEINNGRSSLVVTSAIGLLHGMGFGFVLQEILGLTSANIWVSLLSFNVGVEIGQLGVILLLWPLMRLLKNFNIHWYSAAKWIISIFAIALASVWTGQRLMLLLNTI